MDLTAKGPSGSTVNLNAIHTEILTEVTAVITADGGIGDYKVNTADIFVEILPGEHINCYGVAFVQVPRVIVSRWIFSQSESCIRYK